MYRARRPVHITALKTVNPHDHLPGKEPHIIIPTCGEILKLAPKYNIISVCREVYADVIAPITLLRRIARQNKRFFLLGSIEGGERWGYYSFLGYDLVIRVTCKNGSVTIESSLRGIPSRTLASDQPLQVIREILSRFKSPSLEGQPPSTDGFVGYFAYAMAGYTEPIPHISRGSANDLDLALPDRITAYDHLEQKIKIVVNMRTGRTADPDPCPGETQYLEYLVKEYGRVCGKTETIASLISQSSPLERVTSPDRPVSTYNVSKETFCRTVEKTKKYILDGSILQAVVSRQFTSPCKGSLLEAYRVLRATNPSPYMIYMNINNDEIISTSPGASTRLKDGHLTTFPMAGSRSREATPEENRQLEKELLGDKKELSEYSMLVDLGHSDIGKIIAFDSVEVTEYKMIHRYSKIVHVYSQVEDDIGPGLGGCSAIETLLPAGTLSGAPKIRACRIIEELEQMPRRIHGGALGYLDFTGNLDTCIAIRATAEQGGKVTVQAGGNIAIDSVPENECEESANKAGTVINAVIDTGGVNDRWSF